MDGSIIDGIRDCEVIQNSKDNKDYKYSVINALIYYHSNYAMADNVTNFVNQDKLTILQSKIYDIEPNSVDIINSARFFWYLGDNEKFDELVEKVNLNLKNELNDHVVEDGEDFIIKGWRNCFTQEEETQVFVFFNISESWKKNV